MATIASEHDNEAGDHLRPLNTSQISINSTFRDTEDLRNGGADLNESRVFNGVKRKTLSQSQNPQTSTARLEDAKAPDFSFNDEEMLDLTVASENPPSAKKARFIFKRCFDATFNPKSVQGSEKILAPDSDEEN